MLLTLAFFSLIVAILIGVFGVIVTGPAGTILFFGALLAFVWSGVMHLRERRREPRR